MVGGNDNGSLASTMEFTKVGRFNIANENLRVSSEHVDGVTVFEKDGIQYFTLDAAMIHSRLQWMRLPTKEEWDELKLYHRDWMVENLPPCGYYSPSYPRFPKGGFWNVGQFCFYWTSSLYYDKHVEGLYQNFSSEHWYDTYGRSRYYALSVRCFKD